MLYDRVNSIDFARGLVIILIIFFNFFFISNLPLWPSLSAEPGFFDFAGGILYPAFIFFYCITIPFSITKSINEGSDNYEISRSVFARSLILITIGVLLVNTVRVEPVQTGFNRFIWSAFLILSIFLAWNRYPEKENNFFTISGLRLLGLTGLVVLVFKFRSGSYENNGSLIPGWWELPGLAGWGYMVAAFAYLFLRNSLTGTGIAGGIFLALNILGFFGFTDFLNPVRPYFGILTDGFIPFVALSGVFTGILIRKFPMDKSHLTAVAIAGTGIIFLAAGIISYINIFQGVIPGNPSWALISSGASLIIFSIIFLLDEVMKTFKRIEFLSLTGKNMVTAYILPIFFINLSGLAGLNLLFFLNYNNPAINILATVVWVCLIILIIRLLLKLNVRLKF
jgi:hypothetical protein